MRMKKMMIYFYAIVYNILFSKNEYLYKKHTSYINVYYIIPYFHFTLCTVISHES